MDVKSRPPLGNKKVNRKDSRRSSHLIIRKESSDFDPYNLPVHCSSKPPKGKNDSKNPKKKRSKKPRHTMPASKLDMSRSSDVPEKLP